jgi:hypothetical protein
MNSANVDNKGFSSLIKSLNIFQKPTNVYTTEEMKNSTFKKFPRYVKNKEAYGVKTQLHSSNAIPKPSEESKDTQREVIKEYVDRFVKGYMDSKGFEKVLRSKNINPNIEEINKHIRSATSGNVNHKELMQSLLKYKNE